MRASIHILCAAQLLRMAYEGLSRDVADIEVYCFSYLSDGAFIVYFITVYRRIYWR